MNTLPLLPQLSSSYQILLCTPLTIHKIHYIWAKIEDLQVMYSFLYCVLFLVLVIQPFMNQKRYLYPLFPSHLYESMDQHQNNKNCHLGKQRMQTCRSQSTEQQRNPARQGTSALVVWKSLVQILLFPAVFPLLHCSALPMLPLGGSFQSVVFNTVAEVENGEYLPHEEYIYFRVFLVPFKLF